MADQPAVVHIGENSTEQVAFKLYCVVAYAEGRATIDGWADKGTDRKYILDTYAECLDAVKGRRD